MADKLAEAFVELKLKVDDLEKGLAKAEGSTEKSIGKMVKSVAKLGAAFGLAAAAVGTKLVLMASDFEETESKFNTVFTGLENKARTFKEELVESFGVSNREAMFFLGSMQDLLVPMGVAAEQAADLSFEVVKLASDLGSFNNLPTEQVIMDMQSALVGNFETMKKYGIVLNETVIKTKALELGIGDATGKVNAAEKAQIALQLITEGSAAAVGDFARTSDGFANSLKTVKARLEDAGSEMGKALLPAAKELLVITSDLIPVMLDFARAVGLDGRDATQKLADEIKVLEERQGELAQSLSSLSSGSELYKVRALALRNVTVKLKEANEKLTASQEDVKDMTSKTIVEIDKLTSTVDKSKGGFKEFEKEGRSSFESLTEDSQRFATSLESNLQPIIEDVMTGGIKNVDDLGKAIGTILVSALATATASWIAVGIASSAAGVAMAAAFAAALVPILATVAAVAAIVLVIQNLGKIIDELDKFFSSFFEMIIGFFDKVVTETKNLITGGEKGEVEKKIGLNIPFVQFAEGGIGSGFQPGIVSQPTINSSGTAIAGEAGAEAIVPLKNGAIPVENLGGGGGAITLVLQASDDLMAVIANGLEVMSEDGRLQLDKSAIVDRAVI